MGRNIPSFDKCKFNSAWNQTHMKTIFLLFVASTDLIKMQYIFIICLFCTNQNWTPFNWYHWGRNFIVKYYFSRSCSSSQSTLSNIFFKLVLYSIICIRYRSIQRQASSSRISKSIVSRFPRSPDLRPRFNWRRNCLSESRDQK